LVLISTVRVEVAAAAVGFEALLWAVPGADSIGGLAAPPALRVSALAVLLALLAELQVSVPAVGRDLHRARVDLPTETAGAFAIPRGRALREAVVPGSQAATSALEARVLPKAVLQVLPRLREELPMRHVARMALIPNLVPVRLADSSELGEPSHQGRLEADLSLRTSLVRKCVGSPPRVEVRVEADLLGSPHNSVS